MKESNKRKAKALMREHGWTWDWSMAEIAPGYSLEMFNEDDCNLCLETGYHPTRKQAWDEAWELLERHFNGAPEQQVRAICAAHGLTEPVCETLDKGCYVYWRDADGDMGTPPGYFDTPAAAWEAALAYLRGNYPDTPTAPKFNPGDVVATRTGRIGTVVKCGGRMTQVEHGASVHFWETDALTLFAPKPDTLTAPIERLRLAMCEMNNRFVPANWGAEYTLAGAVWKPVVDSLMVVAPMYKKELPIRIFPLLSEGFYSQWRIAQRAPDGTIRATDYHGNSFAPLLPSPTWINAQSDPRAAAIAALERAGFRFGNCKPIRDTDGTWLYLKLADDAGLYVVWEALGTRKPVIPANVLCELEQVDDPALARYAADCFAVLHQWASEVQWEAKDE